MDVVAAFVADAVGGGTGTARRSCARPPSAWCPGRSRGRSSARRSSPGCRGAQLAAALARVVGAVAVQPRGRRRGRPRRPRTGGIASTSGSISVMSLQLPPVSDTTSGATAAAGDQVVLGAAPGAVDRARTGLGAPQTPARASCRSPPATSRSALPRSTSRAAASCICCQTPACCHSRNLRQQVIPEPQPICCGNTPRGSPSATRTRSRSAPSGHRSASDRGTDAATGTFGINCSNSSHNSSDTNGLAIVAMLSHEVDDTRFVSEPRVPAFR